MDDYQAELSAIRDVLEQFSHVSEVTIGQVTVKFREPPVQPWTPTRTPADEAGQAYVDQYWSVK